MAIPLAFIKDHAECTYPCCMLSSMHELISQQLFWCIILREWSQWWCCSLSCAVCLLSCSRCCPLWCGLHHQEGQNHWNSVYRKTSRVHGPQWCMPRQPLCPFFTCAIFTKMVPLCDVRFDRNLCPPPPGAYIANFSTIYSPALTYWGPLYNILRQDMTSILCYLKASRTCQKQEGVKLHICSQCTRESRKTRALYCRETCQRADWQRHKVEHSGTQPWGVENNFHVWLLFSRQSKVRWQPPGEVVCDFHVPVLRPNLWHTLLISDCLRATAMRALYFVMLNVRCLPWLSNSGWISIKRVPTNLVSIYDLHSQSHWYMGGLSSLCKPSISPHLWLSFLPESYSFHCRLRFLHWFICVSIAISKIGCCVVLVAVLGVSLCIPVPRTDLFNG